MSRQVKCILQDSWRGREDRITHIGGDWGQITTEEGIRHIENGTYSYYVKVGSDDAKVVVASRNGKKYLKTESDNTTVDNLLSLPNCS